MPLRGYSVLLPPIIGRRAMTIAEYLVERLHVLADHQELTIDDTVNDGVHDVRLLDSNGQVVLTGDIEEYSIGRTNDIGGSTVRFLLPSGYLIFTSIRDEYEISVSVGEIALGQIQGDPCGRDFTGKMALESGQIRFVPNGCIQNSLCCCCCNSCCIFEYKMTLKVNQEKVILGSISCDKKTLISFHGGVSITHKAIIIAGALFIYQLYFAPCCGNVGLLGSRTIYFCPFVIIAVILLLFILLPSVPNFLLGLFFQPQSL